MLDLIVFLKSSGANVNVSNLTDTILTFNSKNPNTNYKFYLVIEDRLTKVVDDIFDNIGRDKLLELSISDLSWAKDFNIFLDKHSNTSEWLLITHDDVEFVTDNYFESITTPLKNIYDNLGWVTSTNEHYFKNLGRGTTDTFRAGFYKDNNKWPKMFQLHRGPKNLDYPDRPVKIHGPMSAIMIIRMESMRIVGECEDWTPYTMLIDEDWSLTALKNNLINVWVPNVHHLHPLRINERAATNRWETEAHNGFLNKWGFNTGNPNITKWEQGISIGIDKLNTLWDNTLIPWSTDKNSYDWEYIDE
jgi:hypothetical protein